MFSRLRCHFCGQRSQYSKGIPQFKCTSCEAHNFFDKRGNITEPPQDVVTSSHPQSTETRPFHTFSRPRYEEEPAQDNEVFCSKCRTNQQIYMESLSNYLPDEDHPQYYKFEAKLPEFKADLERKYPQVCKKCASKAQERIHKADYYSKTQQTAKLMQDTQRHRARGSSPIGQRDDWGKWAIRIVLSLIGTVVYASLLAQVAWHAYGMLTATSLSTDSDDGEAADFAFDPAFKDSWYHHTHRVEAVHGQTEHFRIQVLLLIIRTFAWFKLSNSAVVTELSKQQQLAAHGFLTVFVFLCQWISERAIRSDKWKLKGTIMPRPEVEDVFGATAGPASEDYTRQASSVPPQVRLFARDEKPFPIENLAPKRPRGYSKLAPPSPPNSDPQSDDDEMDTSWQPKAGRPQTRSAYNYGTAQPLGWGAVRNELFDIQDNSRAEDERRRKEAEERAKLRYQPPVDQSPFRSRLPQAPMSTERKLRNPPRQFQLKKAPLSKQQDFMKQMQEGIENGKGFGKAKTEEKNVQFEKRFSLDDDFSPVKGRTMDSLDEEILPAKSRTKGSLNLREGTWRLPSDYDNGTGLEDLFAGSSFTIADRTNDDVAPVEQRSISMPSGWMAGAGVLVASVIAWNIPPIRRTAFLWLAQKFEGLGH
ncbi:hypothetical protein LTR37_008001 [Vermiconidia calcicola]|uniref:Uncharacterized protein n=1 Tax=Vermiconidia calcicola TaxID=1690605 RepID=A0ACC3ND81_9PEZI|nr:hypothetical protein LTR37_008001 [Vermiconidia calcicola]